MMMIHFTEIRTRCKRNKLNAKAVYLQQISDALLKTPRGLEGRQAMHWLMNTFTIRHSSKYIQLHV
jgi:hypothetical protein